MERGRRKVAGVYLFDVFVRAHEASAADDADGANGIVRTGGGSEVGLKPANVVDCCGKRERKVFALANRPQKELTKSS